MWPLAVLVLAGCAEIVGANFDERTLRPDGGGADGGGAAGATGGAGVGANGGSGGTGGSTSSTGGGDGCLCVEVPDGWQGPVVLWLADAEDDAPDCAALHPNLVAAIDAHAGLSFEDAVCDPCSCDASGVSCATVQLSLYTATDCAPSAECYSGVLGGDLCAAATSCGVSAIAGLKYNALPGSNGACVPVPETQTPTVPPVSWLNAARVCAPDNAPDECEAPEVCLPHPGSGSALHRPCVYQDLDDLTCPAGFDDKYVIHSGVADTRGCSPCDCFGATCGPLGLLFTVGNASCGGQTSMPVAGPGQCVNVGDIEGGENGVKWHETPSCPSSGGTPTGSVTATSPTTLCCAP